MGQLSEIPHIPLYINHRHLSKPIAGNIFAMDVHIAQGGNVHPVLFVKIF